MGIFRKPLTPAQRTSIKIAKINQRTGKSAISEAGKTVRTIATQMAASRAIESGEAARTRRAQIERDYNNDSRLAQALDLYNKMFEGNSDQSGESGSKSTTEVGGSGSAINGR